MAHKTYLDVKERQRDAHREEEAEFRRQMMEKYAEDDRIEQMNAQRRRMKQLGEYWVYVLMVSVPDPDPTFYNPRPVWIPAGAFVHNFPCFWSTEHRRAVEKLIEERRAEFVHRKEMEVMERREEEERAAERRAIVEQERQRLLKEHATKLLGYLPKVCVCVCVHVVVCSGLG